MSMKLQQATTTTKDYSWCHVVSDTFIELKQKVQMFCADFRRPVLHKSYGFGSEMNKIIYKTVVSVLQNLYCTIYSTACQWPL